MLPHLKTVPIRSRQVLHKNGEPLRAVYFPNGGVASITTMLLDGTMVEAATVGDEGMVGIEAFLGADAVAPGETLMQVPDTNAEMMSVEDFRREVGEHGALHDLLGRYAGRHRPDDAINRLQRHASGATTLRSLAAHDPRPDA